MSRKHRRAHLQPEFRPEPVKVVKPKPPLNDGGIPDVDNLDVMFQGRWRELLPKWEDLTRQEQSGRGDAFCDALNSLFFSGGKLADHGITFKEGVDGTKVMRYIKATLGDFGPSHEHKIGGIAHMLKQWCHINPPKR